MDDVDERETADHDEVDGDGDERHEGDGTVAGHDIPA
jgi:hypothetical protein